MALIGGLAAVVALVSVIVVMVRRDDSPASSTAPSVSATVTSTSSSPGLTTSTEVGPTTTNPTTSDTSVVAPLTKVGLPTNYTPTLAQRDCASDPDASAVVGVQCWTLTVPEDRTNPARTIDLLGYRLPAVNDPATAPTVIDLGPTTTLANNPLTQVANVVMVPSRGFGLSTPAFDCPELYAQHVTALALTSGDATMAAQELEALQACHDRLVAAGFNLASYNVAAETDDVTDYMVAAGLGSALLTAVAQDAPAVFRAADRYPGTFTGVFLDNPVDPGSSFSDAVNEFAAAYTRLVNLCLADASCAQSYPNLGSDSQTVFKSFRDAPQLVSVEAHGYQGRALPDRSPTTAKFDVLLDGARLTEALFRAMSAAAYGVIPSAIHSAAAFEALDASFVVGAELGEYGVGASFYSYECAALQTDGGIGAASAAALPAFAGVYDATFADRCKIWDVPLLPPEFMSPTTGPTPTFLAVGELAPTAAIRWADAIQTSRPNTTVITFATLGSFIVLPGIGPPCYQILLRQFILDPTNKPAVNGCVSQAVTFIPPNS